MAGVLVSNQSTKDAARTDFVTQKQKVLSKEEYVLAQ
jgi:hypothetical protein